MMNNIVAHNWDDEAKPDNEIKVIKCHPELPIDWVIYPNNGYGIGVRVVDSGTELKGSDREFIKSEVIELGSGYKYLTFFCTEPSLKPIFNQLCLDLINFCVKHVEIKNIGVAIIERAKAWERLFNKGTTGLGKKAAKGLFAELFFLENYWLISGFSMKDWSGPGGDEVDFRGGNFSVEVKVKTANNTIKVSSLEQLKVENNTVLFTTEVFEDDEGRSIDDYVEYLLMALKSEAKRLFIDKVVATGYIKNKNYNKSLVHKNIEFYSVDENFPRIEPNQIKGIIAAKYDVDLALAAKNIIIEEEYYAKTGRI
jgi:hypothetical protein